MTANEVAPRRRTCPLCEAMCGLTLEVSGDRVLAVRGDPEDAFSRGYICPKAVGLMDVHHDPDRLGQPLRRRNGTWERVGWDDAVAATVKRLADIRRAHGDDAVALYVGNPAAHSYSATLAALAFARALHTRNVFSTASVDHLPHMFAAYHSFGNRALLPVPDVDRTHFLLIFGANPVVSNGSLMSAPNMARRLKDLRSRGGRLVVVDPRRTRTADLADTYLPIRPGTDVLLLLAVVHTIFAEELAAPGRLAGFTDGIEQVRQAVGPFPPERAAPWTGIQPEAIRRLARQFAAAPSAACYGRLGVCTQPFGALCCWLMTVLNVITGNLDRVGGAMFTTPAVDLVGLAAILRQTGTSTSYRSRVRGLPEFSGELPLACLAEEIDTPGPGQVRALVTLAGNPVLSGPNARRLEAALASLEFMVAIDFYLNETTRHADVVLPGTFALEHDHYDLLLNAVAVRNVARYSAPVLRPPASGREDWQILLELATGIARHAGGLRARLHGMEAAFLRRFTPRRVIALALRFGPYGAGLHPFREGLSLRELERAGRTIDLGPLQPGRLPRRLFTKRKRILLAPEPMLADLERVDASFGRASAAEELVLIGRRQLRDNNSWMHNVPRLMKGRDRCTLWMNPAEAARLGLADGQKVVIRSRAGTLEAPLQVTDEIREGVVSLPHGYGHGRDGTWLTVANANPGVCINDVTDHLLLDELSGTSAMNGVPVTVEAAQPPPAPS
jgi:anaerobic selenocysteine-containing dehydrogenase